jgi:hypothetical protein
MKRFELHRAVDETGVSGTGLIAEGVEFSDKTACMRWRTHTNSTTVYDSMSDLEKIHGHNGQTKVVWVDHMDHALQQLADALPGGKA